VFFELTVRLNPKWLAVKYYNPDIYTQNLKYASPTLELKSLTDLNTTT